MNSLIKSETTSSPKSSDEIVIDCDYFEPHKHRFPADWFLGGSDGLDFRADARFVPSTYVYFDNRLQPIHITSAPGCDHQAIDEFSKVAGWGDGFNPVWLQVTRKGGKPETLPITYDKTEDAVYSSGQGDSLS